MNRNVKIAIIVALLMVAQAALYAADRSKDADFRFSIKIGDFRISNTAQRGLRLRGRHTTTLYRFDDDWKTYCRINGKSHLKHHNWRKCGCPFCTFYRNHRNQYSHGLNRTQLLHHYMRILKNSRDDDKREKAADKLGDLGDRRAVNTLIDAMLHDREDDVRKEAAHSLGQICVKKAVKALQQAMLYDPSRKVRKEARKSLEKIARKHHLKLRY